MTRLLVVEDDPAILRGLTDNLRLESYHVVSATDGATAYRLASEEQFDLVLLDVMLPKLSGFELCRRLRSEGATMPILMLTSRADEIDRVQGLDLGADDYVTKPFSLRELLARIRALLRRTQPNVELPDEARFDDVEVNFRRYEATKAGVILKLSRKEFGTLRFLIAVQVKLFRARSCSRRCGIIASIQRHAQWITILRHSAPKSRTMPRDPFTC